jgi:Zn-dependent protease/CBS domain-containing protein
MKAGRRERRPLGGLRIGSVFGFEIKLDLSWSIIFFLVFWSLAEGVFPARFPDMTSGLHLVMALVATLLFFASLVAHELSHALVSRSRGVPVEGITLFLFGGVARARKEPDSARDELLIAGVGPLTSAGLALLFAIGARLVWGADLHPALGGVLDYLALINLMLAAFNLLPGFPLDGGRVFRALAWRVTGDRMRATRWAVAGGRWLGVVLMMLGAVQALGGAPLSGLWLVFIGWFVRGLATSTLQHEVLRELMHGWSAADVMSAHADTVSPDLPLDSLVSGHFLRMRHSGFPVVDGGSLVGLVTPDEVVRVPRERWTDATVADVMVPLGACVVVAPDAPLAELLEAVGRPGGHGRVLVVDDGRLLGVISAGDVALWIRRAQAVEGLVDLSGPKPTGLRDAGQQDRT